VWIAEKTDREIDDQVLGRLGFAGVGDRDPGLQVGMAAGLSVGGDDFEQADVLRGLGPSTPLTAVFITDFSLTCGA
jgi:hypothetical protein